MGNKPKKNVKELDFDLIAGRKKIDMLNKSRSENLMQQKKRFQKDLPFPIALFFVF